MSKTGIKKNKKPRNLHQRRYKENSIYEEEWLVDSLNHLDIDAQEEKKLGHFFNLLVHFKMIEELKVLSDKYRQVCKVLHQKKF